MEGRWDQRHLDHIRAMDCDVLLLTEVSERVELPGITLHGSDLRMAPRRHWAAVASRNLLAPCQIRTEHRRWSRSMVFGCARRFCPGVCLRPRDAVDR